MTNPRHLRIFLSSPGDVADERNLTRALVKESLPVLPFLRDKVTFDVVSWDDPDARTPTPAHLSPQVAINRNLKKPSECDVLVVILWSRMGTPLPADEYLKADGSAFLSGTEWEYEDGLASARTRGKPAILVYRRKEVPQIPITLDAADAQERREQWARVQHFFAGFRNEDGSIRGGTHEYGSLQEFRDLLSQHLQAVVRDLLHETSPAEHELDEYRRQVVSTYNSFAWTRAPIEIFVTRPTSERVKAREYLRSWANAEGPRCLVMVGEFGSGKTGLLLWLSAELISTNSKSLPLFLSLADVRQNPPRTVGDLARLANPSPSNALLDYAIRQYQLVVLLDGLDEVVNPMDRSLSPHRPVFSAIANVIPFTSRIVLTCRNIFYDAVAADVMSFATDGRADSTDAAISFALKEDFAQPEILTLCDVTIDEGERYLRDGPAGNVWPGVKEQFQLTEFLKSPFTLKLLERALPALLTKADALDLDRLYEVAMQTMLVRDGRIPRHGVESTLEALEELAVRGAIRDQGAASAGLACGILTGKLEDHGLSFQHRSLAEFFFARALCRQLAGFDASILSRIDLIRGFNICRFLVPRLRRNFDVLAESQTALEGRWIVKQEFAAFCRATGWRDMGWGWTPFDPETAQVQYADSSEFKIENEAFNMSDSMPGPATSISWFDAFQYCRWSGRKMLSSDSVAFARMQAVEHQPRYCWAVDWHNERSAYVTALEVAQNGDLKRSVGINPDYRSKSLGIAVA